MIKKLVIENFKSVKQVELSCKKVNVFIGQPNVGKSNILEVIGFLSYIYFGNLSSFVRFDTGMDLFYDRNIENKITISFDDSLVSISLDKNEGKIVCTYTQYTSGATHQEEVIKLSLDGREEERREPKEIFRNFKFYRFEKSVMRGSFSIENPAFLLPPHGINLAAVLLSMQELRKVTNSILDAFNLKLVIEVPEGKIRIEKQLEDIVISHPYHLLSETIQKVIFFLTAIKSNRNSVLAFEEPEAHSFPYYVKYLAEVIAREKNENQFFISTHNPYFLTSLIEKVPKENIAVFITYVDNWQTKVKALSESELEKILELGIDVFFNIENILKKEVT